MAYEKTTWSSGDIVSSAGLNNIENGVANAHVLLDQQGQAIQRQDGDKPGRILHRDHSCIRRDQ